MVEPRDHNEIKPSIRKIFWKLKKYRHYLAMFQKLSCSFVNKVYDIYNTVSYLKKNKKKQ